MVTETDLYKKRWFLLFKGKTQEEKALRLYEMLWEKYGEKHRAYHNFKHVTSCLMHFDRVKDQLADPCSVEFALWFHDVIYGPQSSKNEEKSAEFAAQELSDLRLDQTMIRQVERMILVTKHPCIPTSEDEKYVIDIDLTILGASPHIFMEYESNIRREYKWVPSILYKRKRVEVLRSFLAQDRIYQTAFFCWQYEQIARENLEKSIKSLL